MIIKCGKGFIYVIVNILFTLSPSGQNDHLGVDAHFEHQPIQIVLITPLFLYHNHYNLAMMSPSSSAQALSGGNQT